MVNDPLRGRICPAVFILRDSAALMGLRHYKESEWKTVSVWTTPGGKCELNESSEDALRRGTEEETGINELNDLKFIGAVPGASGRGDIVHVYIATSRQEPQNLEAHKFAEWRFIPLESVPKNFINPAALSLVKRYLHPK
ncbi:MAG: hypothetical protein RL272_89 [Candidatus Parcubacteria bacterium]